MIHRPFSDETLKLLNAAVWYVEQVPSNVRGQGVRLMEIEQKSIEEMQKRLELQRLGCYKNDNEDEQGANPARL